MSFALYTFYTNPNTWCIRQDLSLNHEEFFFYINGNDGDYVLKTPSESFLIISKPFNSCLYLSSSPSIKYLYRVETYNRTHSFLILLYPSFKLMLRSPKRIGSASTVCLLIYKSSSMLLVYLWIVT